MSIIGITPLYDDAAQNIWMLPAYLDAVRAAGGVPVVLTPTTSETELAEIVATCDGFVFTGGQDIDPSIYKEELLPCCDRLSPERDGMETRLLPLILAADKPVLGICRGMQLMNACLGGTLYQDMPSQFILPEGKAATCHKQPKPYTVPTHAVAIAADTLLADCLDHCQTLEVNSLHHQGVKALAPELRAAAVAPDGIVEAIEHPGKRFFVGVQWHPEYLGIDHICHQLFVRLIQTTR